MSASAVVLAAGKGTRFYSDTAKVLHPLAGRTMLRWVLEALRPLALERVVVVVGHQRERVQAEAAAAEVPGLVCATQVEQAGTGHAVRAGLEADVPDEAETVVVVPGDAPLLTDESLAHLLEAHRGRAATLLTTHLDEPSGYGRITRGDGGWVTGVVEDRDATEAQRAVTEVATSVYAFDRDALDHHVAALSTDNAKGEEYLTDVIAPMAASPAGVGAVEAPAEAAAGVNDRAQLADAAAVLRRRIVDGLMLGGVSVADPATTYVEPSVVVGADAVLLPGSHLEGATQVGAGASVGPDSRLVDARVAERAEVSYSVVEAAEVGPGCEVGPFAYLRPGARLEADAKVGAYVEVKRATVGERAKVPHLSYVGDASIGAGANVGAGTVTCNYDGAEKHHTTIGEDAFIGSDTMLVAPVTVGEGAVTGAASAITTDVPAGALAIERTDQRTVPGWVERRRQNKGS
jgi:bifunctional UDP-N-acetylglucosamine pyrophosphorylase/glucosamine-1-phosphate N-acetyltransferase